MHLIMACAHIAMLATFLSLSSLPGIAALKPVALDKISNGGRLVEMSQKSAKRERAPDLLVVFQHNQRTRNAIKSWITSETLNASVGNYGLGPPVESLAKDTGKDPIQHDFVSQLGARLEASGQMVRYLEIGVSVLKSIHTQSHFFRNAVVTSLDIEDPNPTIESLWKSKTVVDEWDADSFRALHNRKDDYIRKYKGPNNNTMYYAAGDAYSDVTYDHLRKTVVAKHGPMNIVLSDAYHTASSVTSEVDKLLSYGIIVPGKDFALVWDDCEDRWDGIYSAMTQIFRRLRFEFRGQSTCSGKFTIPGWVGRNEGSHGTCIFSTMDLSGPHLQASQVWNAKDSSVTCVPSGFSWSDYGLLLGDRLLLWWLQYGLRLLGFVCIVLMLGLARGRLAAVNK
jgi:hypothetical protein